MSERAEVKLSFRALDGTDVHYTMTVPVHGGFVCLPVPLHGEARVDMIRVPHEGGPSAGSLALAFLDEMLSPHHSTYVDLGDEDSETVDSVLIDGWVAVTPDQLALLRRLSAALRAEADDDTEDPA